MTHEDQTPILDKSTQPIKLRFEVIWKTIYKRGMSVLLKPDSTRHAEANALVYSQGVNLPTGSLELCNIQELIGDRLEPGCDYEITITPVRHTA